MMPPGKTINWTTTQVLTRRSLLGGIGALLAAPYIVRAASLMPVKAYEFPIKVFGLGSGATAYCHVVNGGVTGIVISGAGSGYDPDYPPIVTFA